jgi:hypothetical protein
MLCQDQLGLHGPWVGRSVRTLKETLSTKTLPHEIQVILMGTTTSEDIPVLGLCQMPMLMPLSVPYLMPMSFDHLMSLPLSFANANADTCVTNS